MKPPPGTRILIVEDEAIIAMTAEDMIEEIGCVVAGVAAHLEDALARAKGGGFDVVMLDINLNGMQSLPVAALLAETGLPFVFTTGYGLTGLGADFPDVPVLSKPYRADQLRSAIGQVLGGRDKGRSPSRSH
jgi:CheY-like chemotaxis protein